MATSVDQTVRLHIFEQAAATGTVPSPEVIASGTGLSLESVQASLRRLADGRVIVLSPTSPAIWMANPFSAVPTDFRVIAAGRSYFGNCIWDALGIPAILGADGYVEASCGDCGQPMRVDVRGGAVHGAGVVHFAVPARHWWVNIGYT